jgi:hypothetical protein
MPPVTRLCAVAGCATRVPRTEANFYGPFLCEVHATYTHYCHACDTQVTPEHLRTCAAWRCNGCACTQSEFAEQQYARSLDEDGDTYDTGPYCAACGDDRLEYCEPCDRYHERDGQCPRIRLQVRRYDYNPPTLSFYHAPGESTNVARQEYVGLELEVAFGRNRSQAEGRRRMQELWDSIPGGDDSYFKHDGSIAQGSHGEGVEIVSFPATWTYWQLPEVRARWSQRLAALRQRGFRSYDAQSCGIHLHVSRTGFTATQLARLQSLIYDNQTLFKRISQRTNFEYCSFEAPEAVQPWQRIRRAGRAKYGRVSPSYYCNPSDYAFRRVAVNLPDDTPTVEFRFFRGTLHEPSFWKAFECVRACAEFVREHDASAMRDLVWVQWVYARERQFPRLAQFLDRWYRELRQHAGGQPRGAQTPQFEFPDLPELQSQRLPGATLQLTGV